MNYRGRKPRWDEADRLGAIVLLGIVAILAMALHADAELTGVSVGRQLRAALTTSDIATDEEVRSA